MTDFTKKDDGKTRRARHSSQSEEIRGETDTIGTNRREEKRRQRWGSATEIIESPEAFAESDIAEKAEAAEVSGEYDSALENTPESAGKSFMEKVLEAAEKKKKALRIEKRQDNLGILEVGEEAETLGDKNPLAFRDSAEAPSRKTEESGYPEALAGVIKETLAETKNPGKGDIPAQQEAAGESAVLLSAGQKQESAQDEVTQQPGKDRELRDQESAVLSAQIESEPQAELADQTEAEIHAGLSRQTKAPNQHELENQANVKAPAGLENPANAKNPAGLENQVNVKAPAGLENQANAEVPAGLENQANAEEPAELKNQAERNKQAEAEGQMQASSSGQIETETAAEEKKAEEIPEENPEMRGRRSRGKKRRGKEAVQEEQQSSEHVLGAETKISDKEEKTEEDMEANIKNTDSGSQPEQSGGKTEKNKKKVIMISAAAALTALFVAGGSYIAFAQKYNRTFFPKTEINGVDASGRTVAEVKELIAVQLNHYALTIEERGGVSEQITGEAIGLRADFDGSLEKLMSAQRPLEWLKHQFKPESFEIETMVTYDEEAFQKALEGLSCTDPLTMIKPENARLSDYVPGQGYSIIPEIKGSITIPEVLEQGVRDAVVNMKETLSLEEIGAYENPRITQTDSGLEELKNRMNRYAGMTITYQFGSGTEELSGERIHEWVTFNEDNTVSVDPEKAAQYVEELSIARDTYNKAKTIKTSTGQIIEVKGGTYGWKIDRAAETEELVNLIMAGESVTREPVYAQSAASRDGNDYGNTYVEINLTAQHLYYYKDGSLVVESDFVSGNLARGWGTPAGTYPLNYKQRNAVLKGENYRTPVDYWMPFNGGIGLHDATWRSSFGGSIYKTGGSHGCVNLPHSVAKKIFESISPGTPVICYNLPGTEKKGSTHTPPAKPAAPVETPPALPPAELPPPELPPAVLPGDTTVLPGGDGQSGPGGAVQEPVTPPDQAAPPVQETQAPAGPGSDPGANPGSGPGAGQ